MSSSVGQLKTPSSSLEHMLRGNPGILRNPPYPQNKHDGHVEIPCLGCKSDGLVQRVVVLVSISNRIEEHFRCKSSIHRSHLQSSCNGTIRTIPRSCYFLNRRTHLFQSHQGQTLGGESEHQTLGASTYRLQRADINARDCALALNPACIGTHEVELGDVF